MQRICFTLRVRPGKLTEYKARHRDVWPDMLHALSETGWTNYSLFLRPDGLLIGYFETEDIERATKGMEAKEVNTKWQNEMSEFFERPASFEPIEQVFYLP